MWKFNMSMSSYESHVLSMSSIRYADQRRCFYELKAAVQSGRRDEQLETLCAVFHRQFWNDFEGVTAFPVDLSYYRGQMLYCVQGEDEDSFESLKLQGFIKFSNEVKSTWLSARLGVATELYSLKNAGACMAVGAKDD